ncbi:DUF962 domain-containing protein [Paenibacillus roseipurpureus]|uniref:DUF962 domain-containing protein n=1 Tax=Paenibacillus roseopurpureus TaxID=2918901 RepID=A0AA96LMW9_9BACL|nr:DUF962 domain-containing protein [Paenibacillus sp. MBLB1832]WNR44067.1 DUF962 domain-containing protein [Paenibacillus sp. MBLB1832]
MKDQIRRDLNFYMKAHQNRYNQTLHYFAFLFAFLGWIFLFNNIWVTLGLGILHYVFSWVGHFYFEGNKPASFRYPLVGFYIGFMWFFIRTFEMITGKEIIKKYLDERS